MACYRIVGTRFILNRAGKCKIRTLQESNDSQKLSQPSLIGMDGGDVHETHPTPWTGCWCSGLRVGSVERLSATHAEGERIKGRNLRFTEGTLHGMA